MRALLLTVLILPALGWSQDRYKQATQRDHVRRAQFLNLSGDLFEGKFHFLYGRIDASFRAGKKDNLLFDIDTYGNSRSDIYDTKFGVGFGTPIVDNRDMLVGVLIQAGTDSAYSDKKELGASGWSAGGKVIIAAFDDKFEATLTANHTIGGTDRLLVLRAYASYCPSSLYKIEAECKLFDGHNSTGVPFNYGTIEITGVRNVNISNSHINLQGLQFGPYIVNQAGRFGAGLTLRLNYVNR